MEVSEEASVGSEALEDSKDLAKASMTIMIPSEETSEAASEVDSNLSHQVHFQEAKVRLQSRLKPLLKMERK